MDIPIILFVFYRREEIWHYRKFAPYFAAEFLNKRRTTQKSSLFYIYAIVLCFPFTVKFWLCYANRVILRIHVVDSLISIVIISRISCIRWNTSTLSHKILQKIPWNIMKNNNCNLFWSYKLNIGSVMDQKGKNYQHMIWTKNKFATNKWEPDFLYLS